MLNSVPFKIETFIAHCAFIKGFFYIAIYLARPLCFVCMCRKYLMVIVSVL